LRRVKKEEIEKFMSEPEEMTSKLPVVGKRYFEGKNLLENY
jgi:hypothetical protein